MKYLYSIALLNAAAYAACSQQTMQKYLGFAATNNKNVEDVADLGTRLGAYEKCIHEIDWMNQHATGVTFGENWPCDLTDDEKSRILGLRMPADADQ